MLDRKTPPTYHQLTDIKLQLAEKRHLSKGVPLHILNAGKQEVTRLDVIFRTGSIYEEKKGQAFFTTKMLSEGSARFSPREIALILDSHGAHLELSPGFDFCTLSLYTINKHLPKLLPIIRSIVTEAEFPETEFNTLKEIRKQKLRVDNSKNAVVASKRFRNLLFPDHPYGHIIEEADINALSAEELLHFYQSTYYQNFELLIAGAIDHDIEKMVADTFEDIPFRELSKSQRPVRDISTPKQENIHKKDSLQSSIRTGRPLFNMQHPDFNHFSVLNTLFGGYFGSRLMKSIREEKGYTYGVYSSMVPMKQTGYFVIGTDVIGEFTQQTIEEIHLQMNELRKVPIDKEELESVKNYMLGSFLSSLNTPFALADRYKTIYLNELPLDYYDHYIKDLNQVNAEDILQLAETYLKPEDLSSVLVGNV